MWRNSSKSALKPWLITPPSRSHTAGSGNTAACKRCAKSKPSGNTCIKVSNNALSTPSGKLKSANNCKPSRKPDKSRGRALPTAMRAAMRSMSPKGLNAACKVAAWGNKATIACWRNKMWGLRVRGWCSQVCNKRLPIWVAQSSKHDNKVGAVLPLKVRLISKLRRLAASI